MFFIKTVKTASIEQKKQYMKKIDQFQIKLSKNKQQLIPLNQKNIVQSFKIMNHYYNHQNQKLTAFKLAIMYDQIQMEIDEEQAQINNKKCIKKYFKHQQQLSQQNNNFKFPIFSIRIRQFQEESQVKQQTQREHSKPQTLIQKQTQLTQEQMIQKVINDQITCKVNNFQQLCLLDFQLKKLVFYQSQLQILSKQKQKQKSEEQPSTLHSQFKLQFKCFFKSQCYGKFTIYLTQVMKVQATNHFNQYQSKFPLEIQMKNQFLSMELMYLNKAYNFMENVKIYSNKAIFKKINHSNQKEVEKSKDKEEESFNKIQISFQMEQQINKQNSKTKDKQDATNKIIIIVFPIFSSPYSKNFIKNQTKQEDGQDFFHIFFKRNLKMIQSSNKLQKFYVPKQKDVNVQLQKNHQWKGYLNLRIKIYLMVLNTNQFFSSSSQFIESFQNQGITDMIQIIIQALDNIQNQLTKIDWQYISINQTFYEYRLAFQNAKQYHNIKVIIASGKYPLYIEFLYDNYDYYEIKKGQKVYFTFFKSDFSQEIKLIYKSKQTQSQNQTTSNKVLLKMTQSQRLFQKTKITTCQSNKNCQFYIKSNYKCGMCSIQLIQYQQQQLVNQINTSKSIANKRINNKSNSNLKSKSKSKILKYQQCQNEFFQKQSAYFFKKTFVPIVFIIVFVLILEFVKIWLINSSQTIQNFMIECKNYSLSILQKRKQEQTKQQQEQKYQMSQIYQQGKSSNKLSSS